MSELPKGWAATPLLDIVELHDNRRIPLNATERAARRGSYPYYGANGQVDTIDDFLFDGDYILLAEDGGHFDDPARGVAYEVSGKFWVNNHAHILSVDNGLQQRFVSYALNALDWMPYVSGTTRLKLTQQGMRAVRIPLPPAAEQTRIARKLDSLYVRTQTARDELDRVPLLIGHYKQAILEKAFSGRLTASERERSNWVATKFSANGIDGRSESLLADLPIGWCWTSMDQISEITGGLTKNAKRAQNDMKVPYLRVANVYANELRLDEIKEIGCSSAELEKTLLRKNDLLIVEGNGSLEQIGRVAIWDGSIVRCSHQNHLIRARANGSVPARYILYWLLSPVGRQAIEQVASSSAGLHTLSITKVSGIPVPVTAYEEAEEVVGKIEEAFARIDTMGREFTRADRLLEHLEGGVLTKAFRGELVPQDPNDEPGEKLLERIRASRATGKPKSEQPRKGASAGKQRRAGSTKLRRGKRG